MKYNTNSKENSPINKITKIKDTPILMIHGDWEKNWYCKRLLSFIEN